MMNAKTRNALSAMSLLSFNEEASALGVWRYSAGAASAPAANSNPSYLQPVTMH